MAEIRDMMGAFELYQPMELDGALELLRSHGPDAWILSGGLDTFDWLKDRAKSPGGGGGRRGGSRSWPGSRRAATGVRIGAMTEPRRGGEASGGADALPDARGGPPSGWPPRRSAIRARWAGM